MTEYNGYTNYETWNICLWLSNEEHAYLYCKQCRRIKNAKELSLDLYPNGTPDMSVSDYDRVNWNEVQEMIDEF